MTVLQLAVLKHPTADARAAYLIASLKLFRARRYLGDKTAVTSQMDFDRLTSRDGKGLSYEVVRLRLGIWGVFPDFGGVATRAKE